MIDLGFLDRRPAAVLGLGISGTSAAKALAAAGVPYWAWDDDTATRQRGEAAGLTLTDLAEADLAAAQCLVLSPGIPHQHPYVHPLVDKARKAGLNVICDVELLCRAQPAATFAAITGTNGKSTATALLGDILARAGRLSAIGANIGVPALSLPPLGDGGTYVLELSSYQLELMPSLSAEIAVLLNISPDHLERHGGLHGYIAAKARVLAGQLGGASAIIGIDDAWTREIYQRQAELPDLRVIPVTGCGRVDGGVYVDGGILTDATDPTGGAPAAILDMREAPALPGAHNAQNAAAACAAAVALGIGHTVIADAIRNFRGLAHRQELIAVIDGVAYVNDSKATNPDAAARALSCYDAVYWIAGGRAKEGGLEALKPALGPVLGRVRHVFLIGEAAEAFAAELAACVPASRCGDLETAVNEARARALSNGMRQPTVLLSPACASFDQFRNFEARGEAFRRLVTGVPA